MSWLGGNFFFDVTVSVTTLQIKTPWTRSNRITEEKDDNQFFHDAEWLKEKRETQSTKHCHRPVEKNIVAKLLKTKILRLQKHFFN